MLRTFHFPISCTNTCRGWGLGCSAVVTGSFFSPKYHRHPIAHPGGRGIGYLLWVQCLTYVSPWSVYCCNVRSIWYHGIFVRVIMAPDWISGLMSSKTGMSRLLLSKYYRWQNFQHVAQWNIWSYLVTLPITDMTTRCIIAIMMVASRQKFNVCLLPINLIPCRINQFHVTMMHWTQSST